MKLALFKNRGFILLWIATLVSTLCLSVSWIGESAYAIEVLRHQNDYGLILMFGMLPRLIFMAVGGVFADIFSRKNIISSSLIVRSGLLLALGTAIDFGLVTFGTMLALVFLYGILDACCWPARDAILMDIVDKSQLTQANSILLMTGQAGTVSGFAIGGMLVAKLDFHALFTLLGVVLCISTLLFLTFFPKQLEKTNLPTAKAKASFSLFESELKEGIAYIKDHPQFSVLMAMFAVANLLFTGPLQQSVPLLAYKDLSGPSAFGSLWTFFSIGMGSGGILMSIIAPQKKRFLIVVYMLIAESIFLSLLAIASSLVMGCVFMFIIGFCVACNNIPTTSILQHYSDQGKVGRVMGFNETISMGLMPVSYLAVSLLLNAGIGHKTILAVSGFIMLSVCVFMLARFPVIRRTD